MRMIDASSASRLMRDEETGDDAGLTLSLLHHEIPHYVEAELERLYGNIYSSLNEWRATGKLSGDTCSYIEHVGERVTSCFLFHVRGREIRVLNEGIALGAAQAQRFAKLAFERYPAVCAISFHAIGFHAMRSAVHDPAHPCRHYNCLEDIVLSLPADQDSYFAGLGSATRSYIKRYLGKARRVFPSFRHEVVLDADIEESDLREVIALNRLRMEGKGKVQGIDDRELRRIVALAKECGMLSVLRIDGRICAGTINFRAGDNYFLEVIAHDPALNDYRLGMLCCYLTIDECIARGGREYHFLWGEQEYKFRLGGVRQELEHVTIWRSRWQALLCPDILLRNLKEEWLRKARIWWRSSREGGSVRRAGNWWEKLFPKRQRPSI